jgi:hypothetical protein
VCSYVKNLETGYDMIWKNFLQGKKPKHMYVRPEKSTFASSIYSEGYDAENAYLTTQFPTFPLANRSQVVSGHKMMDIHDLTKHLFNVLDELEVIATKSIEKQRGVSVGHASGIEEGSADGAGGSDIRSESKDSVNEKEESSHSDDIGKKKRGTSGSSGSGVGEEMCSSTPLTVQTSRRTVKRQF